MDKKRLKGRPRTVEGGARNPIDQHVGGRVEQRRQTLGLTRANLGRSLKLTSQQIEKFEHGTNRISASRLFDFARVLEVPIGFFFEDLPGQLSKPAASGEDAPADPMALPETVELLRAFQTIPDPQLRRSVFEMTRALAAHPRFGAVDPDVPPRASGTGKSNGAMSA